MQEAFILAAILPVIHQITNQGLNFIAAAVAFGMGAIAAGWAIGQAGAAGLAASAERPELRTTAIIIAALGEALAIYGIVIAFQVLAKA